MEALLLSRFYRDRGATKIVNQWKNFTKGFIKENPVFVLLLGLCPTLGVTTSALNGLGMGIATTFVLVSSNVVISLIKNFIPNKVRIPCFNYNCGQLEDQLTFT